MHTASIHKENIIRAFDYGFDLNGNNYHNLIDINFSWERLAKNVQLHIRSLNFGFKAKCSEDGIDYINAIATLYSPNKVLFSDSIESVKSFVKTNELNECLGTISADSIVIANGGKPIIPDEIECKGAYEHSITSDDIFQLKKSPGKTLVIGASYIALETAGFLAGLGLPVSIMVRRTFLRGFDSSCGEMVVDDIVRNKGVEIIPNSIPYELAKNSFGKTEVSYKDFMTNEPKGKLEFDTVIFAIGRKGNSSLLNLKSLNILQSSSGKIITDAQEKEATNSKGVYVVGDMIEGAMELTPLAIKAGQSLAKRIFYRKNGNEAEAKKHLVDYSMVPTTIFTPLEYSCVGLSEDEAIEKFGVDNLEIYHSRFVPLEEALYKQTDSKGELLRRKAYVKIICRKEDMKVIGAHYLGPNSGEIMQLFAVAIKLGVTKHNLDDTIGIHPTIAEEFIQLKRNKLKGENPDKNSC